MIGAGKRRSCVTIVLAAAGLFSLAACSDKKDDPPDPTYLQLAAVSFQVSEGAGSTTITVTRSGDSSRAVSIDFATFDTTAQAGSDYAAATGTLSWPRGDIAPKSFAIVITDDFAVEGDETLLINLWNPSGADLGSPSQATLTIRDDDLPGSLQFSQAVYDSSEGAGSALITVTRTGGAGDAVGVTYSTTNGTATAGSDYVTAVGTLSWVPGDASPKSFWVSVIDDGVLEGNETVLLSLTSPTGGATMGSPRTATLNILDDEMILELSAPAYQVNETGMQATITVRRTGVLGAAIGVDYSTSDGTATAPSDYTAAAGTLSWAAGDAADKTFTIDINDDSLVEGEEIVNIALQNPTGGGSLGAVRTAALTILDDEVTLQFGAATYTTVEGTPSLGLTVSRLGGASMAVSADYATSDGTATAPSDYTPLSGTLNWLSGDVTDKTIWILIADENAVEPDETLSVTLSNPLGAALGVPSTAVVTIENDDATLQFSAGAYQVDESAGSATITVTRLGATAWPVSVDYGTSDGTATSGSDYTPAFGTLNWPSMDVSDKTFTVAVTDDLAGEPDETVNLAIGNPGGGAMLGAPATAVLTLIDDDTSVEFTSASYQVSETGLAVTISVARSGTTAAAISVDYSTSDGTATATLDYTAASGTLNWGVGDGADKSFTVDIIDDPDPEGLETVDIALGNPTGGASLGARDTAVLTIVDDETTIQLTSATYQVDEFAAAATITVSRIGGSSGAIQVDYATSDGTATEGIDYAAASGTLSWNSGDMTDKSFTVAIIDDFDLEADETVDLTLSNPVGAPLAPPSTAVLTIVDDEIPISGDVTFDRVPVSPSGGLDYGGTAASPCRGITVDAVRVSDLAVVDSVSTDDLGGYTVIVPMNTLIYLRVVARMELAGSPAWDVRIVDNTSGQAIYASVTSDFDSGPAPVTGNDIHLDSGWGGSSYTSTRSAAPFAILDTVYEIVQKVLTVEPNVDLPLVRINWSVNNIPVWGDRTLGEVGSSHYDPTEVGIYLLGEEDNDTEEYDPMVIAHEFSHYIEDQLARSDSIGGAHALSDRLDMRVALGEGLATALAAIFLDDSIYVDTGGAGQGSNLVTQDVEDNSEYESDEGWFSETSVQVILYDCYDGVDDGADTLTMGLAPIWDVLVNDTPLTDAFSTIFSFSWHLEQNNPGDAAAIDALLAGEQITTTLADPFDSTATETNNGGEPVALPIYERLTVGGGSRSLCSNGNRGNYNKLANRSLFYFDVPSSGFYTIRAVPDANGDAVIYLWSQGGFVNGADSGGGGFTETLTENLSPGTYVGEVFHLDHVQGTAVVQECFDVSVN